MLVQGLFNVKDKLGRGALLVALMAKAGHDAVKQLITVRFTPVSNYSSR